jgi:hypothetical protein
MSNLSHWDFAENFSPSDAAALILGYEPSETSNVRHQVRVVFDRMKLHYINALEKANLQMSGAPWEYEREYTHLLTKDLPSVEMLRLWGKVFSESDEISFINWLNDSKLNHFDIQSFSSNRLADWLDSLSMKSIYQFRQCEGDETFKGLNSQWPWGDHNTKNLEHLSAAAFRYYGPNFDPYDKSTAPTNAVVSEWLQTERKVSKNTADFIASILRPDGLPTGPRN